MKVNLLHNFHFSGKIVPRTPSANRAQRGCHPLSAGGENCCSKPRRGLGTANGSAFGFRAKTWAVSATSASLGLPASGSFLTHKHYV